MNISIKVKTSSMPELKKLVIAAAKISEEIQKFRPDVVVNIEAEVG